jgi:hypothetical protein
MARSAKPSDPAPPPKRPDSDAWWGPTAGPLPTPSNHAPSAVFAAAANLPGLSPSDRCGPASLGRRRPRRRAADQAALALQPVRAPEDRCRCDGEEDRASLIREDSGREGPLSEAKRAPDAGLAVGNMPATRAAVSNNR